MADDTWTIIENRMKALKPLHDRMDLTKDLVYMEDFKLRDFEDTYDLSKVINVTGNRGSAYGHRVIENLASYIWQTVVEGEITKREAHKIEEFLDSNLDQTNIYLTEKYGIPDLHTFLAKHICNRGRIGVEWLSWIEKDEYKIHCLPLDMRWTPYVLNKWVAPITWRRKEELEQELEEYEKKAKDEGGQYTKPVLTGNDDIEVRDYWDNDKNELWVAKSLVYTQKHNLEKPPFVIVVAPSGFMFRDRGYQEHEGEDIYFLIRKLEKELNRSLSIEQTIGMDILYPPYERETDNMDATPAKPVPKTGEVQKVRKGELAKPVPRGDLNKASVAARQDILRMMDEGSPMQPRAYTSPPSAIEVATEVELLNQLINSRVTGLQMAMSQLYRLMIDQFIIAGKTHTGELEIGKRGRKKQFSVAQLKDPEKYSINTQLMVKNKKLEIVNEARALALWGRAPLKYILRDVLMVEDPDGWERALELQKAKAADPALDLFEMGVRYAEEAEDLEDPNDAELKKFQSMMLIHRGIVLVKQSMQPAIAPSFQEGQARETKVADEKGSTQGLINILGTAGQGGVQPKQPVEVAE